jgi:hypothetical protein
MQARDDLDLALDGLLTAMKAWRDREVAAGLLISTTVAAGVNFDLERDRQKAWEDLPRPLVDISLSDESMKGGGTVDRDFSAKIRVACYTPGLSAAAASRHYYLREQARAAALYLPTHDQGLGVGRILKFQPTGWSKIEFDDADFELTFLAGAWDFTLDYSWKAGESATSQDLTALQATCGAWAALYNFT